MIDRDAAARQLLEMFTESYLDKLFYFCLKKTDTPHEAEDLTSDIALNVIAALHGGTVPENFPAWVWQIARNRYSYWAEKKQKHRDRQVDADIGELELGDDTDGVLDDLISRETLALLRRELAFISSDYRSIVVEHYHHGRSAVEIARELGIPEGTVRSKLYHARRILKEGMRMTREFGKLSYDPGYIGFSMGGHRGENGEPLCLLKRKICKNILFAAWRTPMTAEELSIEIGLPLPYIEDELGLLVTGTIMKKQGNLYAVTIPIVSSMTVGRIRSHLSGIIPEIASSLIEALEYKIAWLDENCPGWHGGYQSREDMRWGLLMWETEQLQLRVWNEYAALMGKAARPDGPEYFPHRPRGGRWIVVGVEGVFITELWTMSCRHLCSEREGNVLPVDFRDYHYWMEQLQPSTPFAVQIQEAQALGELVNGDGGGFSQPVLQRLLDLGYIRENEGKYQPTVCVIRRDNIKPMPPEVEKAYRDKLRVAEKLGMRHYLFCRNAYTSDVTDALREDERQFDYTCEALSILTGWVFEEARRTGYLNYAKDEPRNGLGVLLTV